MSSKREVWIDYIKVVACILVVLGHFFQSMMKASILPDNNLYQWFNTTIYYFHVPLFFICSGYLYQRYSHIDTFKTWKNNILKKLLYLGVPYFVFTFATWLLKTVFSSDINDKIGGLGYVLFIHPTSPYWYLYTLILIFVAIPTIKTKKGIEILSGVAIIGKLLQITSTFVKPDLVCDWYSDSFRQFAETFFKNTRCDTWSGIFSCQPLVV